VGTKVGKSPKKVDDVNHFKAKSMIDISIEQINIEYGEQIFLELLGKLPKNGGRVRLFDDTRTSQDTFYRKSKYGFPTVHNFTTGETYTPFSAYAKAHGLDSKQAYRELRGRFYMGGGYVGGGTQYQAPKPQAKAPKPQAITIDSTQHRESLQAWRKSNLMAYLATYFDSDILRGIFEAYKVGKGFGKYDTAFWYYDSKGMPQNAKLMVYDRRNGKRDKNTPPSWYHAYTKQESPNSRGFFGEHLTAPEIWIVESEKSALILAAYFARNGKQGAAVWACGGKANLGKAFRETTADLTKTFVLVPDGSDGDADYKEWEAKGIELAAALGLDMRTDIFLTENLTDAQKAAKWDIADWVLSELTPLEAAPLELTPLEAEPLELAPLEAAPLELAPLEAEPLPLEAAPAEAAPAEAAPAEAAPLPIGSAAFLESLTAYAYSIIPENSSHTKEAILQMIQADPLASVSLQNTFDTFIDFGVLLPVGNPRFAEFYLAGSTPF
jgi:hypothetical protein